jgi:hypothetical protein
LGRAILKAAPISEGEIIFDDEEREFDVNNLAKQDVLALESVDRGSKTATTRRRILAPVR